MGIRVDTLRAWERRYGLLDPERTAGGFRLYSRADEAIVHAMIDEIDKGYPPAQAAKLALGASRSRLTRPVAPPAEVDFSAGTQSLVVRAKLEATTADLYRGLMSFDGARAQHLIDSLLAEFSLNTVLRDAVMPCLRRIGDAWFSGDVSVAQEHFATQLIRERLLGLAREWDHGRGPRALLACPAQERHDLALICFGLVLSRSGWRITFLGSDTPIEALTQAVDALAPDLVVLAANEELSFTSIGPQLSALAAGRELALAGAGATPAAGRATAATILDDGPVEAAVRIGAPAGDSQTGSQTDTQTDPQTVEGAGD